MADLNSESFGSFSRSVGNEFHDDAALNLKRDDAETDLALC